MTPSPSGKANPPDQRAARVAHGPSSTRLIALALQLSAYATAGLSLLGCAAFRPPSGPISLVDDSEFYHDEDPPDDLGAAAFAAVNFGAPAFLVYSAKKAVAGAMSIDHIVAATRRPPDEGAIILGDDLPPASEPPHPLVCLPHVKAGSCR